MFVFDTKIATVRPYLLLGAAQHENDYATLREAGVTHILQVGSELRPSFPDRFEYLRVGVDDLEQEDIICQLRRCFKFINDARYLDGESGGKDAQLKNSGGGGAVAKANATHPSAQPTGVVLVHCMAGMSRSASVVVAYLMWGDHLPYVEAFKQVKAARPCIYPNLGFLLQLWEWESLGCDLDSWPGWSKVRYAERLAEYRRAQDAAGLHRAVRVKLPMSPSQGVGRGVTGTPAATDGAGSDRPHAENMSVKDDIAGKDPGDNCGRCSQGRIGGDGCGGNSSAGGVGIDVIHINVDSSSGIGNRGTGCGGAMGISCHANAMNESHLGTVDNNFANAAVASDGFSNLQPPANGLLGPLPMVGGESKPRVACDENGAKQVPNGESMVPVAAAVMASDSAMDARAVTRSTRINGADDAGVGRVPAEETQKDVPRPPSSSSGTVSITARA
ncbi:hypothetical protein Vretimale_17425 [Volvox reticuliferus]|uniref:Protein-tyrosine-phosphatase n=1 Tax=Volvox reticuliferus TaxID=1737510 RepID=A0A8J4GWC7_9CHLO|nr:hypothetical protein Vretifemale_9404 [Volvox reticuliferus]GIM14472.1 hypothetical protein Vretimale_17425 [Volvox reticuliferus]